ncbi:MAG TPA: ATP-binding protein [Acidimicrobiales bacterium]|nr:ATP-binding protein [Acidimicrobiales bacterium]
MAGRTVLIVGDDESTRRRFRIILEGEGFTCAEAGSTEDALEAVRQGVDLALCDVRLGDEDGLALVQTLLAAEPPVGVVMISGVDDPDGAGTALVLGAHGHVAKPVRRSELLLSVTNAERMRELEVRQRGRVVGLEAGVWSEFVQIIGHELRTPLTVILAGAGLIPRTVDPARLAAIAASIESQGRRLLQLIERLLEVASLDDAAPGASVGPVDVRGLLAMAAELARAMGRSVVIEVDDDVRVQASQQRLLDAISHIVENAVKFTPAETGITMRAAQDGSDDVVISVVDKGPGIPAEIQKRMWEPFVQADGSAVREHGGLGVGMYLCRRLVEWHGGSVTSHDTPGGGLTVAIRLPASGPR